MSQGSGDVDLRSALESIGALVARRPHPAAPVASVGVEVRAQCQRCHHLSVEHGAGVIGACAAFVGALSVEVRGVVAVVTPNGMRIVLDDGADAFWVRPTLPNCDSGDPVIVSVRLADPTEGG